MFRTMSSWRWSDREGQLSVPRPADRLAIRRRRGPVLRAAVPGFGRGNRDHRHSAGSDAAGASLPEITPMVAAASHALDRGWPSFGANGERETLLATIAVEAERAGIHGEEARGRGVLDPNWKWRFSRRAPAARCPWHFLRRSRRHSPAGPVGRPQSDYPGRALELDRTTMHFDDAVDHGEAEPCLHCGEGIIRCAIVAFRRPL
jgi:hypothetical protein